MRLPYRSCFENDVFSRKARRLYCYVGRPGVCRKAITLLTVPFLPALAMAGDKYLWAESYVVLEPTATNGVAQVRFLNLRGHIIDKIETFTLDLDGLSVQVTTDTGHGDRPDSMRVVPPPGYVADPPTLTLPEYGEGVVVIYFLGY